MNVLSLFDGMSCGRLALEQAGIKVDNYYSSEIDKYTIQVADKNYPQDADKRLGDATKWREWTLPKIDLVIGGSPCQSLSIVQSKTRKNLNGKSKLFFEFVDIMNSVKPKYYLFENVASMNEESKAAISLHLHNEPVFIDSASFSAQQRPRLYWTNLDIEGYKDLDKVLKDIMEDSVDEKYFYNYDFEYVDMNKQVCAIMKYKNHDMHKRIFNPNFKCHTLTTCSGGNTQKKVMVDGRARKLTPLEYERLQTVPDNYTDCVSNSQRYNMLGNGWTVNVIAHIFKGLK